MALLYRDRIQELMQRGELVIESTDERVPFDPELQITSDTIDLRLYPKALVFKEGLDVADTLSLDPGKYFEEVALPPTGFALQPGHMLFASALEIICLTNGKYVGRIASRGTYARFGISVTCGRLKVPAGTPLTPDVQIANHSSVPVRIYPYSFILQIQIETTAGTPETYDGVYPKSIGAVPPKLSNKDASVATLLDSLNSLPKQNLESDTSTYLVEDIGTKIKRKWKPSIRLHITPRLRSLLGIIFGGLSTLVGGILVNIISNDTEWSQWKITSFVFALIILLILLGLGISVILSSE